MKYIIATNKKRGLERKVFIDDDDYENVKKYKWYLMVTKKSLYARAYVTGDKKLTLLHHFIKGYPPNRLVTDHIDNDTMNNSKSNLRFVSQSINLTNRVVKSSEGLLYRGVYKLDDTKNGILYCTKIRVNGKQKYLASGYNPRLLYEKHYVPNYIKIYGFNPIERGK